MLAERELSYLLTVWFVEIWKRLLALIVESDLLYNISLPVQCAYFWQIIVVNGCLQKCKTLQNPIIGFNFYDFFFFKTGSNPLFLNYYNVFIKIYVNTWFSVMRKIQFSCFRWPFGRCYSFKRVSSAVWVDFSVLFCKDWKHHLWPGLPVQKSFYGKTCVAIDDVLMIQL